MANEGADAGPLTKPVFKVADHQVAGHRFEDGRVGSLIDDSGRFYKPLQDGARGDKEVTFYNRIWSDPNVPPTVQKFFPKFYGTVEIETPNGGGNVRHAIMEDLTHGFQHPNIIDVKMGARTWYLEAGPKYVEKCKLKDKETTSEALGFRLSGMQVYEAKKGEVWKASRAWCKYMKPEDVPEALKRFVSSNPSAEKGYDGAFAKAVYGAALTELQQLKAWLEVQTTYHFFSASVLLIYEGEPTIPQAVSVRLVDFAHVVYDKNEIDENQLSGLNALMKMLMEIIDSSTKALRANMTALAGLLAQGTQVHNDAFKQPEEEVDTFEQYLNHFLVKRLRIRMNEAKGTKSGSFFSRASEPARILFEGNIGVGKSTILRFLQLHPHLQQKLGWEVAKTPAVIRGRPVFVVDCTNTLEFSKPSKEVDRVVEEIVSFLVAHSKYLCQT